MAPTSFVTLNVFLLDFVETVLPWCCCGQWGIRGSLLKCHFTITLIIVPLIFIYFKHVYINSSCIFKERYNTFIEWQYQVLCIRQKWPYKFLVFQATSNRWCLWFFQQLNIWCSLSFALFFFYWLLYNLVNIKWICLVFAFPVSTPVTNTPSSLTFPVMFCDCCENCKVNSFEIKSCLLEKSKLDLWLTLITRYILL